MLNNEQKEAVSHIDGPCVVTACPGSGKTRVIVHRANHLINSGIDPRNILMLTFTNKAAKEMKSRLSEMISNDDVSSNVTCCTFHSLCVRILKKYYNLCCLHKNFNIANEDDCIVILNSLLDSHGIKFDSNELKNFIHIINLKRENEDLDLMNLSTWFSDYDYSNLIKDYIESIKKSGNIDFTGLLHETYTLLKNNENIKNLINGRFKYVMVDEVQDTNLLQFEILKLLSTHKNIFMVGDLDQSIYKFRGARPENMIKFCQQNDAKVIRLNTNYRCGKKIIDLANNIIIHNKNRLNSSIIGEKNDSQNVYYGLSINRDEEAINVAKKIKNIIINGASPKEIAILFRTNHISRSFEIACSKLSIPYEVVGAFKFFEREEIKDIVSMLKFLNNNQDTMSLFRFINKPKRGIGPKLFSKFTESYYSKNHVNIQEFKYINDIVEKFALFGNSKKIIESIDFVLSSTDYYRYLKTKHPDSYEDRIDNINELKNSCVSFDSKNNTDLNTWLLNIMLMDSQDGEENLNKIRLMSMHAAKGLEFENVFIVALEDGVCPHKRSIEENNENIDKEGYFMLLLQGLKIDFFLSSCIFPDLRNKKIANVSRFLIESNFIDTTKYCNEVSRIVKYYQEGLY